MRSARITILATFLALCAGCQTVGTRERGIDNFAVVEDGPAGIYRGAQPSAAGIETLKSRGVRTVIDLRDDARPDARENAEAAGLAYIHIPTNASHTDPAKIRTFLHAMSTSPRPVFVHCKAGCDRTGLEIAMYRVVVENWSRDEALRELYAHGYHWALFPGIARYVKTFDATRFSTPAPALAGG
jgi:tyrosine-protein phosphatase SIW14